MNIAGKVKCIDILDCCKLLRAAIAALIDRASVCYCVIVEMEIQELRKKNNNKIKNKNASALQGISALNMCLHSIEEGGR